jgi:HAD superfamily hydrolase (TIGR01450 family)
MSFSLDINKYKVFVFDLDGTIYVGEKLLPCVKEVIEKIKSKQKKVIYLTNNSAKTKNQIVDKLQIMGLSVDEDDVINSGYALAKYLQINNYLQVYTLGTDGLKNEINRVGIIPNSNNPQAIVIGYDPDFNFSKLELAISHYYNGCKIIVANKERTYPKSIGLIAPGAGPAVAAFEYAVNKTTDVVIGKPSLFMLKIISEKLNVLPKDLLMIGDSCESDYIMANNFGSDSILLSNDKKQILINCTIVKDLCELYELIKD